MSKAFTREDDDREEDLEPTETAIPGGKNYITPSGAKRLRDELKKLLNETRPKIVETVAWAASLGDRSENADYIYGKRRLREIDRRIRFLTKRLEAAEIINPVEVKSDRVRFGATVTVHDEEGHPRVYSIVGIDETDVPRGRISWISPLGRALLNHAVGESVTLKSPKGEEDLEIVSIVYTALD